MSISAQRSGNHTPEPRLVRRHYLHPDAARVPLSGRDHGLGHAQGSVLAVVEQFAMSRHRSEAMADGHRVLHRGAGGCPQDPWSAEIFNTDQGSQFTSPRFTQILHNATVKVSMDGRGRWMDNVMIERLWSLKYECVYLNAFETGSAAREGIGNWIDFYNTERPHSALGGRTPVEAHQRPGPQGGSMINRQA